MSSIKAIRGLLRNLKFASRPPVPGVIGPKLLQCAPVNQLQYYVSRASVCVGRQLYSDTAMHRKGDKKRKSPKKNLNLFTSLVHLLPASEKALN